MRRDGGRNALLSARERALPASIMVNRYGRRFANEYMQAMSRHDFYYLLLNYDPATGTFPRNPCYWFFDERRMGLE